MYYEVSRATARELQIRYTVIFKQINGNHPLLAVASDNNNFSDQACSNVRFGLSPIAADLRSSARESIMDTFPWTYRIMAEELMREGRLRR